MRLLRKIVPPVVGVAALVVLILWMTGTFVRDKVGPGRLEERAGLPAPATTETVADTQLSAWYEAVGTIRSRVEATVAPQITGRVIELTVDAGERVEEGQLLVRLESQEYRARLEQARSALTSARAEQDRATSNYERVRRLSDQSAATPEQLEEAENRKRQADAAVTAAEQKVKEAETFLEYTRLESPLDGVVADRLADPGDLAYPGKPLVVVHKPEDLRLEASVREGLIARVQALKERGEELEVQIAAIEAVVRGKVAEIVPSADPVSRSFLVKVPLPPTEGLFPGMFGKLRVELDARPAVVLPRAAVQRIGQLATVRVRQDGKWMRRLVTLGAPLDGRVEILSGLEPGETVGWD